MSTSWKPKTPYLTTDGIVEIYNNNILEGVVVITRKNPPLGVALPGGFVDVGESVEEALKREMLEEIGLEVEIVRLLGIYSNPSRDPRFHTASAVFVVRAYANPIAGDDAKTAYVVTIEALAKESFVFDHQTIVEDYLQAL